MISEAKKERAAYLCSVIKDLSGMDPLEDSRKRDVVSVRMMVAMQLYLEKFREKEIAELLHRDRVSIYHYEERWHALYMPGWEAERELWEKFKKAI